MTQLKIGFLLVCALTIAIVFIFFRKDREIRDDYYYPLVEQYSGDPHPLAKNRQRIKGTRYNKNSYDYRTDYDRIIQSLRYEAWAHESERKYGLPRNSLVSIIIIESGGDPRAYNPLSGASGLCQILPSTARDFGLVGSRIFDSRANIDCAGKILAHYLKLKHNNVDKALKKYFGAKGRSQVDKYWFYMQSLSDPNFRKMLNA